MAAMHINQLYFWHRKTFLKQFSIKTDFSLSLKNLAKTTIKALNFNSK